MRKIPLWQELDFPHFYYNSVVIDPLEYSFKEEMQQLAKVIRKKSPGFSDVLTGEILANSAIEGVLLDRESVNSSFVNNIIPAKEKEQGAIKLTQLALDHYGKDLTHDLLKVMHREILKGSNFPEKSIGRYVGDMKIVSGHRLDQERTIIHQGVNKELVDEKMTGFIAWYNQRSRNTPLVNAIQGHLHFETIHPFCDGNGRIGRTLILMGLCRDFKGGIPLALSRAFNSNLKAYYYQFESGLDLTDTIKSMAPIFIEAVQETSRILELTAFRTQVSDQANSLNPRQLKVLNRLIEYELKGHFKGGLNNTKYQKMTGIGDRTALRDLIDLERLGLLTKTGKLKGTRYHLSVPHLTKRFSSDPRKR